MHANSKSPGVDGLQREGGSRGNKGLGAAASERHLQEKQICGGPGMLSDLSMPSTNTSHWPKE